MINRFSDAIETAYHSTPDLWDRSRAVGNAFLAFARNEPAAYQLMSYRPATTNKHKSQALVLAEERSHDTLIRYVEDMVEAGLLDGDPVLIAHSFWAAMHGLIMLESSGKLANSPDFEALRRAVLRLIARGAQPD